VTKRILLTFIFLIFYSCVPIVGVTTVGTAVKTGVDVSDDPRSLGTLIDDSIIEKKLLYKISKIEEAYLIKVSVDSIDGRVILRGNIDTIDEKIKMTKLAWETDGVRSVENIIKVDDQSSWKDQAKDLLITSQLKVALISHKDVKSSNYSISTINKNLYIFGIARSENEKKTVINEAKIIPDVKEVFSSIFLTKDLSNNKRVSD
jgi:osmotically-inducible protein OsmY